MAFRADSTSFAPTPSLSPSSRNGSTAGSITRTGQLALNTLNRQSYCVRHETQVELIKILLSHLDAGTNVDAETFVNNISTYTDPEQAEREWSKWFVGLPQLIGMSGDLPQVGSFFTNNEYGIPILACATKADVSAPSSTRAVTGVRSWSQSRAVSVASLPVSFMDLRHRGGARRLAESRALW